MISKYFKTILICYFIFVINILIISENNKFKEITIKSEITQVQPFTGLVLWEENQDNNNTNAISLEFAYLNYNDVINEKGKYDWTVVEEILKSSSSRNHHAILRFRYTEPGEKTTVPKYIKKSKKYKEKKGKSEGLKTWFPDWRSKNLENFTLEFYKKFAEKYDNDSRLAYLQVGFGLWGEYHIYDGPKIMGRTFPSKDFQNRFMNHLNDFFKITPWSISIDAANIEYSPFPEQKELIKIKFGLFDDSFMHKNHHKYNLISWNLFGNDRYKESPAGGEFSYLSDYDQKHVLDKNGPYGKSFKEYVKEFHITYMLGNDQPEYHFEKTIRAASKTCGYKFKILSAKTSENLTIIEMTNIGVAPIYFDTFITIDGKNSKENLKELLPGEIKKFNIPTNYTNQSIRIDCLKLLKNQHIGFQGNTK